MRAIILDTSASFGFVSLVEEKTIVHCALCPSKEFLHSLAPLLKDEIDFIAVGIGPGSYSGTRSGVAFAQALGFAKKIPLIRFYSPLAYLPEDEGHFVSLTEAKGKDLCAIVGYKTKDELTSHGQPQLLKEEDLPPHRRVLRAENTSCHLLPLIPYLQKKFQLFSPTNREELPLFYFYPVDPPKLIKLI